MQIHKNKILALLIINCWIILNSCVTIKPDPPAVVVKSQAPVISESVVNLPVSIQLGEIETLLNKELPTELYKQDKIDMGHNAFLSLQVVKNGVLSLTTNGGQVKGSIPILINGKVDWSSKLCEFCPSLSNTKSFQIKIVLQTNSVISVLENWDLQAKTTSTYVLEKPPCIDIAGFPICFEKIAKEKLNENLPLINRAIDGSIKDAIGLKSMAEEYYKLFALPYLVSQDPLQMWSTFKAESFKISPPVSKSLKELVYSLNVKGHVSFVIGNKPSIAPKVVLPPVKTATVTQKDFSIKIPVGIQFAELENFLSKEVAGKEYSLPEKKRKIFVNKVSLSGQDSLLIIAIDFNSKRTKGLLYMNARPVYNDSTKILSLKDIKIDTKTNNILLNKAAWISNGLFNKMIEKKMTFDLSKEMNEGVGTIKKMLGNYPLGDRAVLKMNFEKIGIIGLVVYNNHIDLLSNATGTMEVIVK